MLLNDLKNLTDHHQENCKLYNDYISSIFNLAEINNLSHLPYLPVRAFKEFDLYSINESDIFKIMNSSGTTGNPSKIYLDKETAKLQSSKLIEIFKESFGGSRFPMIVIDSEDTVKDRYKFSARTAAINGFSIFSRKRFFALDSNFKLKTNELLDFIEKNKGQRFFIFGFTFMIWKDFLLEIESLNEKLPLSDSFLLHGGGWKKLEAESVSNPDFKAKVRELIGCEDVRNYYGMIEQTGTIFMECESGKLHAPNGADVIIRDQKSFQQIDHGEKGLIQLFSNIQRSYPGHSILTEDLGYTEDGNLCPCKSPNTVINILGRVENAEIRGCSDAYP